MDTVTPMPITASTTARGLLRLSPPPLPSPLPMPTTEPMVWDTLVTVTMVWATEPTDTPMPTMDTPTTARGPLRLSLPLMPTTTATTAMVPGPTTDTVWATEDTDTEATEATTMDKFSASEVQSRSSKRTSLLVI